MKNSKKQTNKKYTSKSNIKLNRKTKKTMKNCRNKKVQKGGVSTPNPLINKTDISYLINSSFIDNPEINERETRFSIDWFKNGFKNGQYNHNENNNQKKEKTPIYQVNITDNTKKYSHPGKKSSFDNTYFTDTKTSIYYCLYDPLINQTFVIKFGHTVLGLLPSKNTAEEKAMLQQRIKTAYQSKEPTQSMDQFLQNLETDGIILFELPESKTKIINASWMRTVAEPVNTSTGPKNAVRLY